MNKPFFFNSTLALIMLSVPVISLRARRLDSTFFEFDGFGDCSRTRGRRWRFSPPAADDEMARQDLTLQLVLLPKIVAPVRTASTRTL